MGKEADIVELTPVARIRNVPNVNLTSENIRAKNGGVFWQLILNAAAASANTSKGKPIIEACSGERKLKTRYPGLVYNVYGQDAPYWGIGSDYNQNIIFSEGLKSAGKVEAGSKAVAVHENAALRMATDSEFAETVTKRIETWFEFDKARTEAVSPGSGSGLSQGVVIGADGSIAGTVSVMSEAATAAKSWYETFRQNRLIADNVILSQQYAALDFANSAAAQLAMLLNSGELQSILGTTVAGVPTEHIVKETKRKVLGIEEIEE